MGVNGADNRGVTGKEAAVSRAAALIEPLRDRPGRSGDFTEAWGAGGGGNTEKRLKGF